MNHRFPEYEPGETAASQRRHMEPPAGIEPASPAYKVGAKASFSYRGIVNFLMAVSGIEPELTDYRSGVLPTELYRQWSP